MNAKQVIRQACWGAAVVLGAGLAQAQLPPAPLPILKPAQADEPIEIIYGTTKLPAPTPLPMSAPAVPEPAAPVIPAAAAIETTPSPRTGEAIAETLRSFRDGTREVTSAAAGLLGKVGDRIKHTTEMRPIIINTYSLPAPVVTPAPAPVVAPAAPSQPQVVVVREPAPAQPASPPAVTRETAIAGGVGVLGLLVAAMTWRRGSRRPAPPIIMTPDAPSLPLDPNSIHLMGQYNAGPRLETAEQFELGPTYHEEQAKKKQTEEANNAAAVELILQQNLAMLAELNPGSEGEIVHTDAEGLAVPA
jgi:hypothetical protein